MGYPFTWYFGPCPINVPSLAEGIEGANNVLALNCANTPVLFCTEGSSETVPCEIAKASATALLAHLALPHEGPPGPPGPAGPAGVPGAIGATGPLGATGPIGATGLQGPIGFAETPQVGTTEFNTILQTLLGAAGQILPGLLGGTGETGLPGLPGVPGVVQIPVGPGGTPNEPTVLGSTGDPGGGTRPSFPSEQCAPVLREALKLATVLLAERAGRKAQDRQLDTINAYLRALQERALLVESIRRAQQMPFGQSGYAAGGLLGTGVGTALGQLAETGIEALIRWAAGGGNQVAIDPASIPQAPPSFPPPGQLQLPGQQPAFAPGVSGCSPFRSGGQVRATAVRFQALNPVTGRATWFGPLGTPLAFTGDVSAVRRLKRARTRINRALGGRR